jgi:hypothetical protein
MKSRSHENRMELHMIPKARAAQIQTKASLSRRTFMQASVAIGATIAGFPAILRAQDKAGKQPVVVGSGNHTYQWIDNWGQLPDGKKFGNTHSVVQVADGRIFIHNASPTGDCTCIFDPDGKFISSWGKEYKRGAHGMDLRTEDGKEFLYLSTTEQHKVVKTTLEGEVIMTLEFPKQAVDVKGEKEVPDYTSAAKFKPTFIALPDNGDFYIADGYGSNYIHRYNIQGQYIQSWGGTGSDAGKLNCPHGIWVDTRSPGQHLLVVADRGNQRLQWFTFDGKFVKQKTTDLRHPCMFDQRNGELLVPDIDGRVTLLDADNKLITHLGDNPNKSQWFNNGVKKADTQPGIFCTPHSARFDSQGNIFVVEWLPYGRVTKLKKVSA